MLVNHIAKRHPEVEPDSVPELSLPILRTQRDFFCMYCNKVYKSRSKRKAHILKVHPGALLPVGARSTARMSSHHGDIKVPTYSQLSGSVTAFASRCEFCPKQYASRPKLLSHQRKQHADLLLQQQQLQQQLQQQQQQQHLQESQFEMQRIQQLPFQSGQPQQ